MRQFGATGRRADNATRAMRAAVDACFRAGGGVVYVPPGEYTTGTIELKDNVNLHLEAGATLFLSQNKADFAGQRSMIYAAGAKNIAVTGRGTLDGLAQYEWAEPRGADPEIAEETEIARTSRRRHAAVLPHRHADVHVHPERLVGRAAGGHHGHQLAALERAAQRLRPGLHPRECTSIRTSRRA